MLLTVVEIRGDILDRWESLDLSLLLLLSFFARVGQCRKWDSLSHQEDRLPSSWDKYHYSLGKLALVHIQSNEELASNTGYRIYRPQLLRTHNYSSGTAVLGESLARVSGRKSKILFLAETSAMAHSLWGKSTPNKVQKRPRQAYFLWAFSDFLVILNPQGPLGDQNW